MKKVILILIVILWTLCVNAQQDTTLTNRVTNIETEMQRYGRDQRIANRISLVSIVTVVGGSIIGIPTLPLLIGTSVCDLATLMVSSNANKRLSKSK